MLVDDYNETSSRVTNRKFIERESLSIKDTIELTIVSDAWLI